MSTTSLRIDADTSVFGGAFDAEFERASRLFFDGVRAGKAILITSAVVEEEIADALHVALATINHCSAIISWNCRHIVHFQKIPLYNAINRRHGFAEVAIHTPLEVVDVEDQEF